MTRSLNIFQHLTRQWDALHPYNAAQLMHLDGIADTQQVDDCWQETLRETGLGTAHSTVTNLRPISLDEYLTGEMNRPFAADDSPFRPFVLQLDGSHYLGVVYHHWVADSISIRALLREWFFRLYDPKRARRIPFRQPTSGYWRLFGPGVAKWDLAGNVLDTFRWSSRFKRVRRIENRSFPDLQTKFTLHTLPDGLADQMLPAARRCGATLNDLFLAAMALACDRHVAAPPKNDRIDLALGVIVDLRKQNDTLADTFGLFLGFTSVLCQMRDLNDWDQLVATIAQQNRDSKKTAAADASMIRMLGGRIVGKLLSRKRLLEFYRKRLPLSAGISNVNLNRTWVAEYHPSPILDYIRVSPTGPMLPLVFTPSTLGKKMHFGLTHRVSVLSGQTANDCADDFAQRLIRLT